MKNFQLSPERVHLLQKVVKKERDPIEIMACAIWSVLMFLYVYLFMQSRFRHEEWLAAFLLGPGIVFLICCWVSITAYKKLKDARQPRRNLWVNLAICSWGALIAGYVLGDRSYWLYTTNIYSYRDLVSYVDIDPAEDSGQAYMDSGHVYFKEHSMVLRQRFKSFRNGDNYCVAPIIRGAFVPTAGSTAPTMNGYVMPGSGTYDWWAVGTNCCEGDGTDAKEFTCGQTTNSLSRSGMRLLSDTQRPYYLLAVQEWSATYGLPVKHPLFFEWVKDPLETEDGYDADADAKLWQNLWYFLLGSIVVSFLLHMVLHRNKIY